MLIYDNLVKFLGSLIPPNFGEFVFVENLSFEY